MNGIGIRIQQLRRKLGFTQEELAQRLGVTNKTVSKWECGVTAPDLYLIVPLARILEVSTDALLGKETIPAENAREKYDYAYARYKDGANPGEGYWWAREASAAFPTDFRYTLWLADTEYRLAFDQNRAPDGQPEVLEEYTENALRRYESIIDTCADPELVRQAVMGKILVLRFCERVMEADWSARFEYPDPCINTARQVLQLSFDGRRLQELLEDEKKQANQNGIIP